VKIAGIMSKNLVSVCMDDSLADVRHIFDNVNFHHLLVIEQDELVGILSDRDLLKALSPFMDTPSETPRDQACLNKKVHQIMTREVISIEQDAPIYCAINLFNRHKISCLPVVDTQHKAVGILSWRDIMRTLEQRQKQRQ